MLETKEQLIKHVNEFPDLSHAFASMKVTRVSSYLSDWFYNNYSDNGKLSVFQAFQNFYIENKSK